MDKSNLPAEVANSLQEIGSITYANEVIAIIAGMAASEIDGVATMGTASSIADILGRNRRPITKGVRVEVGSEEASVDIVLSVEYGKPIQRVCRDVQDSVRKSIETMTGLHVVRVDVHVLGVSFEKDTQALAEGASVSGIGAGAQFAENVRRGQPVRARKDEPKEIIDDLKEIVKEESFKTATFVESEVEVDSVSVKTVKPDKIEEPETAEEPETTNALPRPVDFDDDDAVYAFADILDDDDEYNIEDGVEDKLEDIVKDGENANGASSLI